jgi:hypothetical protein
MHQIEVTRTARAIEERVGLREEYERLLAVDQMEAQFFKDEVILKLSKPLLQLWSWRLESC